MTNEQLKTLRESPYLSMITLYLKEESDKLRNIDGVGNWEELLGRQFAVKTLDKMIRNLKGEKESTGNTNEYT